MDHAITARQKDVLRIFGIGEEDMKEKHTRQGSGDALDFISSKRKGEQKEWRDRLAFRELIRKS